MAVFRVERTQNYTIMSNYHLRDKSISLKAKGLLSQMLSLPEDWDYTLVSHVVPLRCDCWARMGIIHFNAASGSVIPPVEIRSCVRDSRFDLEDISADRLRQSFGNFGSRPGT